MALGCEHSEPLPALAESGARSTWPYVNPAAESSGTLNGPEEEDEPGLKSPEVRITTRSAEDVLSQPGQDNEAQHEAAGVPEEASQHYIGIVDNFYRSSQHDSDAGSEHPDQPDKARQHGSQAAGGLEDLTHQHADVQMPGENSEQGAGEDERQEEPGEASQHGSENWVTQLDVIEEASQHGSEEDDRLEELMGAAPTINLRELRTQVLSPDIVCTHAVMCCLPAAVCIAGCGEPLEAETASLCVHMLRMGPHACMSVHSMDFQACGAAQVASLPEILSRAQRTAELCARGAPGSSHSIADGSIHSWVAQSRATAILQQRGRLLMPRQPHSLGSEAGQLLGQAGTGRRGSMEGSPLKGDGRRDVPHGRLTARRSLAGVRAAIGIEAVQDSDAEECVPPLRCTHMFCFNGPQTVLRQGIDTHVHLMIVPGSPAFC